MQNLLIDKKTETCRESINIMGLIVPLLDYDYTLELFQLWLISRIPHQVCTANVHTVVTSLTDKVFRDINNNSLITMDGLPLVWYAKAVYGVSIKERVCGPELMLRCLDQGRSKDWKHFFLGGKEEVLNDLVINMQTRFPGIDLVGWFSPSFYAFSVEEDDQLVSLINRLQPDFLWVCMGAPKQEKWIAAHLSRIQVPIQIGVGAAFDFHSGHVRRAPIWMQKYGLEWLFRMLQDHRLIKRYFSTNPIFLALFLRDFLLMNSQRMLRRVGLL